MARFLLLLLLASSNSFAAPLWHDGKGGIARDYYHVAAALPWDRKLGDWLDKDDVPWGNKSYDDVNVFPALSGKYLSFNATELVQKWLGGADNQGILVRSSKSTVKFAARENTKHPPILELTFKHGMTSLIAEYDAVIDKSTAHALGMNTYLKVSKASNGAIWFDLKGISGKSELLSAKLKLHVIKAYDSGSNVSIYELKPGLESLVVTPVEHGLASKYPGDQGLEKHSNVYHVQQFEGGRDFRWLPGGAFGEWTDGEGYHNYVPFSGSALVATLLKGERLGLNQRFRFSQKGFDEPEAAYFRYYLRLGDSWDQIVSGGKLPGFAGTYNRGGWGGRKADGFNGWSGRGAFLKSLSLPGSNERLTPLGSYVYHAGQSGFYGDRWAWNKSQAALLENNRWYCIEQYVRLNDPGTFNGELTVWLDGRRVFSKQDIQFRKSPELKIEEVWFNFYHGGSAKAAETQHLFIDNVVIAREYIGPVQR